MNVQRPHFSVKPVRIAASKGFTLLEILLVLLLLGLAYGLAGPMIGSSSAGIDARVASRQLSAGLRKARSMAVTQRSDAVLTLDVRARTFLVSGDTRTYPLPGSIELALYTAQSELLRDDIGRIRFFPDGSSTGGRITVASGPVKSAIDIDWVTGRVTVQ